MRREDGSIVPKSEAEAYLTEVACQLLEARVEDAQNESKIVKLSESSEITMSAEELGKVLSELQSGASCGLDKVPAKVLKQLTEIGIESLTEAFNGILSGEDEFPTKWREGRVTLLPKPNSKPGVLHTHRPITVSSVCYRLFTKIIVKRMPAWMEDKGILGEMQNGFRSGRRGDDNIFMLTSAIEIARKRNEGLMCTFLDCTKAYD
jgi:hypothetical protein